MNKLYQVILFLAMFEMTALIVSGLGVFPTDSALFSDFDMTEFQGITNPEEMLSYIFFPDGIAFGGLDLGDVKVFSISLTTFTIIGIIGVIAGAGAIAARITQSYAPVVLAVIGILLYPMVRHSFGFFRKLLEHWDNTAMMYLGVTLGVAIFIIFLFTIVEKPTGGKV